MFLRFLYGLERQTVDGAGGGAGDPSNPPADPNTPPADPANGGGAGGEGGVAPTLESLQKENERLKAIETAHKELDGKYQSVTKKLGEQSKAVGLVRQLEEAFAKDPQSALSKFAKDYGLKIKFDEGGPDPNADPEDVARETLKAEMRAELMREIAPTLKTGHDFILGQKYEDFDDLRDNRTAIDIAVKSGQMSPAERDHLAARGMLMADALKAAGEKAVADYQLSLQKKSKEQIEGAGGKGDSQKKGDTQKFENVVAGLSAIH